MDSSTILYIILTALMLLPLPSSLELPPFLSELLVVIEPAAEDLRNLTLLLSEVWLTVNDERSGDVWAEVGVGLKYDTDVEALNNQSYTSR